MSLLLDALTQSEQKNTPPQVDPAREYQQQKQLRFYRRLALALVALLVITLVVVLGFFTGKWLQNPTENLTEKASLVAKTAQNTQQEPKKSINSKSTSPNSAATTHQAQTTSVEDKSVKNAANVPVQPTVNPITNQPYQQAILPNGTPIYVMPAQPNFSQQGYYQWVPAQPMVQMTQNGFYSAGQVPAQMAQPMDMSQYKMAGKPLNAPQYTQHHTQQYTPQTKPSASTVPTRQTAAKKQTYDPALAGVSKNLQEAFAQAVAATEGDSIDNTVTTASRDSAKAQPIEFLPDAILQRIPPIRYEQHIYATDTAKRWIKINGYELYEGDNLGDLRVVEITPEQTLFRVNGQEFTLGATQDWLN